MNNKLVSIAAVVVFCGLWFIVGPIYRSISLKAWEDDYAAALVHASMPLPGSGAAADFTRRYEAMQRSSVLTHSWYYVQANESHKAWAAAIAD